MFFLAYLYIYKFIKNEFYHIYYNVIIFINIIECLYFHILALKYMDV